MMKTTTRATTRRPRGSRRTVRWYESPWRIAGRAIATAAGILLVALVLLVAVVPKAMGGDTLTVLSGSMEPTFSAGDAVAVRGLDTGEVCTDVSVGDIITFFPEANDPTLITHRVVGKTIGTFEDGTNCRLVTQGDANSAIDGAISPEQVRGKVMFSVPKLGYVREWIMENPVTAAIIVLAVLLVGGAVGSLRKPRTRVHVRGGSPTPVAPAVQAAPAARAIPTAPGSETVSAGDHSRQEELRLREHELLLRELELRGHEVELLKRELALTRGELTEPQTQESHR